LVSKTALGGGLNHIHGEAVLQEPARQICEYAGDASVDQAGVEKGNADRFGIGTIHRRMRMFGTILIVSVGTHHGFFNPKSDAKSGMANLLR
jgi:hypothetical protein